MEDSKKHFKLAGHHTERGDIQKMENIEKHVTKCLEAERALDWSTLIKESEAAVAAGADFAPQVQHSSVYPSIHFSSPARGSR